MKQSESTSQRVSSGDRIVAAARSYIGAPWRHEGRNRQGLDCVGLIVCAVRDAGLGDYESGRYSRLTTQDDMIRRFCRHCRRVSLNDLATGDFACFITGGRRHCGIYAGATIIHAHFISHCVVEQPWQEWLSPAAQAVKLVALFRLES